MPEETKSTSTAKPAAGAAPAAQPRFTIKATEKRPTMPTHSLVKVVDGVGYSDDPITAHTLQSIGYSVIDGLSGKEYTGTKPPKASGEVK